MNRAAEQHLTKAATYLAKGEGWYRKAATEIGLAKEAGATWAECADGLGYSVSTVQRIMRWAKTPANPMSPETKINWERGSHATVAEIREGAQALLRSAPLEQVEQIISDLPADRQRAIGAAAGNAYLGARQEHEEREARRTPAERQEREAGRQATTEAVGQLMTGFNAAAIANNLGLCTEILREMISDHSVTEDSITTVEPALDEFLDELRVARAMAGLDPEREGV